MKSLVGQLVENVADGELYTVLAIECIKDVRGVSWCALLTRYLGNGVIISTNNFNREYWLDEISRKRMEP